MKRFITFGSIEQFRTIIKTVQNKAMFVSFNEETQTPFLDKSAKMPIVTAIATEKIHGTNASVCYSNKDGFWVQSRKNIIDSPNNPDYDGGKDNAGCASFAYSNKDKWMEIILSLAKSHNINLDENIISVYFEWSGGSIQKKSAMTGLDKRAVIFQHFKVSPLESQINEENEIPAKWFETLNSNNEWIDSPENNIFNIMNFQTWKFQIDFEQPLMSQNKFIDLVANVIEPNSPIGKSMGKDGNIGEGLVITFSFKGDVYKFKVKGEKHAKGSGKIKTLKPVDTVFEQKKIDFVNNHACKEFRFEQAWQEVFGIENEKLEPTIKAMGDFLRLVIRDVMKEESDIMEENGLNPKSVNSMISRIARGWFSSKLDEEAGLS